MDYSELLQAVTTVGFPIVMCGALFWYMIKQNETHTQETNALREAVDELKLAITKLIERIGMKDE